MKRHHHVVGAVIGHEGRILCMQRGPSRYAYTAYKWEFPGGKVEDGETEPEALRRELREELDMDVQVGHHIGSAAHEYADFAVSISFYWCTVQDCTFHMKEHNDFRWLRPEELSSLDWLEADGDIIAHLSGNP